nr:ABC transporter ATP-binding protein [Roseibium aestuarii]
MFERWIAPFSSAGSAPEGGGTLALVVHFVRQARWPFALMLVLGGAMAGVEASLYVLVGDIVDRLEGVPRATFLAQTWPILAAMAAFVIVARTLTNSLSALVEEQAVVPHFFNLVRWQSHKRVMTQSLGFFHEDFSGRLAQKVMQSGFALGDFMVNLLQTVWYILVYALSTLVLLGQLSPVLGLVVAVWLASFAVLARYFVPRVRQAAREMANGQSRISGHLVDTYTNIQTVKLFGEEGVEDAATQAIFRSGIEKTRAFTRLLTSVRSAMALLSSVMMVLIAAMALVAWQDGGLSTGDVAFTLGLVLRLNLLLNRLFGQLNGLFRNIGTFQDSMDTVLQPVAVTDAADAADLEVAQGRIDFSRLSFHYGKGSGVLEGLDLSIAPGERVGLVGPSGAGKSTLVSLLLRFHDAEAGSVRIDGVDVRQVTQESLRRQIGMVTQDTSLLHRSIRDNILYGRPGASEAEMIEAARRAHALDFIEGLSDKQGRRGFDARVGERGVKLSGGQRQRIAIARVLLKNAPILVLDEATSALDSEVEAAIQDNLLELMQGKTVIAIAHRLSTISRLDRLVVMDRGRIVQSGTHEALLRQPDGLYARLWERQSGGFLAEG